MRDTWLWRTAFVEIRPDANAEEQAFFRQQFEAMRERVKPLVARIAADMPGYTVHDVTHLDALWETASLVAQPALALSPPEAFVFGAAVLLHDSAMTLAAYPGGLAELKTTATWADVAALAGMRPSGPGAPASLSPELEEKIKVDVLRRLHAEKAAELAVQGWPTADGERSYLIEDSELRRFYGPRIGTIAHSHWWSPVKIERELNSTLGPMPPKTRHGVDLLKVACLLRVADALHLDRRRAPRFARVLEQPRGSSALHWTFQEKLAFPHLQGDAVVFTAGEAFTAEDADAWWQAFDAFSMADRELRDTDLLLCEQGRPGLAARRVKGADHPEEMARHVRVSGWRPVETRIRISDIPKIVETLGGEKLYGRDPTAPVRELLQNAMDAVQARRRLQNRPADWGQIVVDLSERPDGFWLSVEDSGVGMSEVVLTGALLDFGSSLWRSAQVMDELPGLAAKGMEAIGRFGIGFFSVFMLGEQVRVVTRRYNKGENEALILEFRSGPGTRPILLPAPPGVAPLDGGTRVEIRLRDDPRSESGLRLMPQQRKPGSRENSLDIPSLRQLVGYLAPASDVSIDAIEFGQRMVAVSAGDWLSLPPGELARRIEFVRAGEGELWSVAVSFMREIKTSEGMIYGRAALCPFLDWYPGGALTAGGLRIQSVPYVMGIIKGSVTTAARDDGVSLVPPEAFSAWATEQAKLIDASNLPGELKALCAEFVLEHEGSIFKLPLARLGDTWLNSDELREWFKDKHEVPLFLGDIYYEGDLDDVPKYFFDREFKLGDEVLVVPELSSLGYPRRTSYLTSRIHEILKEAWGEFEEANVWQQISRAMDLYRRLTSPG